MTSTWPWARYHTGRRIIIGGFVLYLPVMGIADFVLRAVGAPENAVLVLASLWMAIWGGSAIWLSRFDCPRCKRRFYGSGLARNVWGRRCVSCGALPAAE